MITNLYIGTYKFVLNKARHPLRYQNHNELDLLNIHQPQQWVEIISEVAKLFSILIDLHFQKDTSFIF